MRVLRELLLLGMLMTVALKAAEGCPDHPHHEDTYDSQHHGDGHGSQYPGDGYDSQYHGDGHGSQYHGDGHSDGYGSQYHGDGHGSQYNGGGHGSQYHGDCHGSHYHGDGYGSQYHGHGHGWYYPGSPYHSHGPHYHNDGFHSHYTSHPFFYPFHSHVKPPCHPPVKPPYHSNPHHDGYGEQAFGSLLEKLLEILNEEKYTLMKEVKEALVKVLGALLKELRDILKEVKYDLLKELKECLAKELHDILKELKYDLLKELKESLVKELLDILKHLKDDVLEEVKACLENELRDLLKEVKHDILEELKDVLLKEVKYALLREVRITLEKELTDAFENFTSCSTTTQPPPPTTTRPPPPPPTTTRPPPPPPTTTTAQTSYPKNCRELYNEGDRSRGVKKIYPSESQNSVTVYCDNSVDGGGWTVFQHRTDAVTVRENFFRNWTAYQNGFGSRNGEFWLGLDTLHTLTSSAPQELRVDLEKYDNEKRYAKYSTFNVGSASENYKLTIGGYSGDAGDSMEPHKYREFSTVDRDHDTANTTNCALKYAGAWWYQACHQANLNGLPLVGDHDSYGDGINWMTWTGYHYSLKTTSMMIRPK